MVQPLIVPNLLAPESLGQAIALAVSLRIGCHTFRACGSAGRRITITLG